MGVLLVRLMDTQYVFGVTRNEIRKSTREILLRTGMHSFPIEMFICLSRPFASGNETLVTRIIFILRTIRDCFFQNMLNFA